MNSYTTEQLLMCEKGDLVKFIEELKGENKELKEGIINSLKGENINENTDHLIDTIADVVNENEKLKEENDYLKLNLKNQDNIHAQDRAEVSEEKKYSTEQRERADKYMEENKKLKKENEEHTYTLQSKEHAINVNHNTLWKMTGEIRQLKDQLDLFKTTFSPFDNYDELDKYIHHLKKKNETWSKRCLEAEALTDKKLKEENKKLKQKIDLVLEIMKKIEETSK
jgi:hypothetical protein